MDYRNYKFVKDKKKKLEKVQANMLGQQDLLPFTKIKP